MLLQMSVLIMCWLSFFYFWTRIQWFMSIQMLEMLQQEVLTSNVTPPNSLLFKGERTPPKQT